jgi:beta-D-xylosidase 4
VFVRFDIVASGICSYNAVNGEPTCASDFLRSVLRDKFNFTGYITSDTGALEDIYQSHFYVKTEAEAACVAIRNGSTDVCSGAVYHDALLDAVQQGLCSMDDVNAALYRTFMLRFQLGLFDPIEDQPYWHVSPDVINSTDNQAVNLLATRSSMVLLQNNGSILPLAPGQKVAVIGPHANATAALVGNYLGQLCYDDSTDCIQSVFQAIQQFNVGGVTTMEAGCAINSTDKSGFAAAVALAQASDIVILALGIDESVESEANDRVSIDLPGEQHPLAAAIVAVGKPTVLVLINGGAVDCSPEKATVPGILEAFYPGVLGAQAIAESLFGVNDHLGGKLPVTVFPADYVNQILMSEMELDVGPGRTYRFYNGPAVFPFGHGLAYTTFQISLTSAPETPVLPTEVNPTTVNIDNHTHK